MMQLIIWYLKKKVFTIANKRMFSLSVVDTDNFLEMPISSRLLYYELGMRADDDGFVDSWRKILLFTGLKEDDMKVLIAKSFVIPFESGVIVIRHWRMNNYLRRDRFNPTHYQKELAELQVDDNNVYNLSTNGTPSGTPLGDTGKIRLDKNSIEYNIYGEFQNVKLTNDQYKKLEDKNLLSYIEDLSIYLEKKPKKKYANHYATILSWSRKENKNNGSDILDNFDKNNKVEKMTKEEKEELDNILKEMESE